MSISTLPVSKPITPVNPTTFLVQPINEEDYPEKGKIAFNWGLEADGKRWEAESPSARGLSGCAANVFYHCRKVSFAIYRCFESSEHCLGRVFDEAFACMDDKKRLQGFLLLRIDWRRLKIAHLVTHPHNIRSPLNDKETDKVTGVGTFLVRFAAKRCLELKKETLYLEGTSSSQSFYERLGFEIIPNPGQLEDGDYAMQMTAQKVQELFPGDAKAA